jgi:hypothetical protein
MKKIPKAVYATSDEIDARIKLREAEVDQVTDATARQSILKEIAQLRVYAEAKRWTSASKSDR